MKQSDLLSKYFPNGIGLIPFSLGDKHKSYQIISKVVIPMPEKVNKIYEEDKVEIVSIIISGIVTAIILSLILIAVF